MADVLFVVAVEQLAVDLLAGQRADRERRDELARRARHHRRHRRAALAQAADEVERLVGRDAAADDEEDALVGKGHGGLEKAERTSVWMKSSPLKSSGASRARASA